MEPSHNARSVVQSWLATADTRHQSWGPAAANTTPSQLNRKAASAYAMLRSNADYTADTLVNIGFFGSHPTVTRLRAIASDLATEANRMNAWAADLARAEQEI